MKGDRPVLIAGGGTAGHVVPALAIAAALRDAGVPRRSIQFMGSRRGQEAQLVPAEGYAITLFGGRGVVRTLSPAAVLAVLGVAAATLRTIIRFARQRPGVVVTVGGYAAAPAGIAAFFWRVPVLVTEQNAVAGAVNRLVGRWAAASAVSAAGVDLPRSVVTGMPVRPQMLAAARDPAIRTAARADLGIGDGRLLIVITTGSLGARSVNRAVVELCDVWSDRQDLVVHHITGRRDAPEVAGRPRVAGRLDVRLVTYEEHMDRVLAAADVAICRAGASTVGELCLLGVPAVLVPLPGAPRDHQRRNAEILVTAGAAVLLADEDLTADTLAAVLDPMLASAELRAEMSRRSRSLGHPDAAAAIARLVLEVAA